MMLRVWGKDHTGSSIQRLIFHCFCCLETWHIRIILLAVCLNSSSPRAVQHLSGRKGDCWLYFFEGKFPLSLPHELGMLVRANNLNGGEVEAGGLFIPKATE